MSTVTTTKPPAAEPGPQVPTDGERSAEIRQIVGFRLADEEYGLDIMKVQEIILIGAITKVPQVPEYVKGLINLRGHVIPIVDLRRRFELPESGQLEDARIIVVNVRKKMIGILVDSVNQVTRVTDDQIEPPPTSVTGINNEFITGLVKFEDRLVIQLDIERLLTAGEDEALTTATEQASASA